MTPAPGTSRCRPGGMPPCSQCRVWVDGREIQLTFREFELLAFLAAHPATVFTRANLVGHVWHRNLGPHYGQYLVTEYRVGYQFRPPPA